MPQSGRTTDRLPCPPGERSLDNVCYPCSECMTGQDRRRICESASSAGRVELAARRQMVGHAPSPVRSLSGGGTLPRGAKESQVKAAVQD